MVVSSQPLPPPPHEMQLYGDKHKNDRFSWTLLGKKANEKKKGEGYAFCKFTFSGLSRFNQMKKTLFKKEIVWLNQLNEQVQDFPQCWSITFTRGTAMGNKIFYGNGLR